MRTLTQIKLETESFPNGELQIARLTGRDTLAQLFEYELLVVAKGLEDFDAEALIGEPAALVYERNDAEPIRVYGMISVVNERFDTEVDHSSCRLVFRPRAYRLSLVETLDIFLDLNVPDILRLKLQAAGMKERAPQKGNVEEGQGDHDFELRLHDTYPVREFVVQYKETDLAFISRLCEHIGITFFFEHGSGRDVMVFTDVNEGFRALGGDGIVPFRGRGEARDVFRLEETIRMIPADYVVRDYNYRTPQLALTGQAHVADGLGSVVEYGSHVKTPKEAEHLAKVRAQESLASRRVYEGTSDLPALHAGSVFTLEGHPRGDLGLLVTEIRQSITQATLGNGTADAAGFRSEFKAIRKDRRYRPPRATAKPRIHGVVTGIIDSANKGQYADIDDQGRYRVKFLFDTTNPGEGQASQLVRMAQPHAGEGYGMHFPLRPGVEVIITFVDGDPDRPIIAATVPNPQTASPVQSANATRNIIRTGGGNEINIDDNKDGHRIKLSTPHKNTTFQLGYRNSPEDGAMLETYGSSSSVAIAGSNSFGAVTNTISLIHEYRSAGSISTVAEKPSLAAKVTSVVEIMSSVVEVASGVLEATKSGYEARLAVLKKKAIEAQRASQKRFERLEELRKARKKAGETAGENADLVKGLSFTAPPSEEDIAAGKTVGKQTTYLADYNEKQEAYESAQRDLMSNEEFLRDSLKGEAAGTYAGEIAYYKATVEKSKVALAAAKAERDAARAKLTAELTKYKGEESNSEESRKAAEAYLDALSEKSEGEDETTLDGKVDDDWSKWTDDSNPQRQYDLQAEELETGKTGTDLKRAAAFFQTVNVAKVLFSDVMGVLALVKALKEKVEEIKEIAIADAAVVASNPQTATASTVSRVAANAGKLKLPIRHTLGSEGDTLVYGEKNLFAWSDYSTLMGKKSLFAVSEEMLWLLSKGKAELAADDGLFLTSKSKAVSISSNSISAVATDGSVAVTSAKETLALKAAKRASLESTGEDVKITAKTVVAVESTDDKVDIKAKQAVFVTSTDDLLNLKAKKSATLESSDDSVFLRAKKDAAFTSSEGDVLIESGAKKVTLTGKTGVVINAGPELTVKATKINLNGAVEVNGALLVKGMLTPETPLALEGTMNLEFEKIELARKELEASLKKLNADSVLKAETETAKLATEIQKLAVTVEELATESVVPV